MPKTSIPLYPEKDKDSGNKLIYKKLAAKGKDGQQFRLDEIHHNGTKTKLTYLTSSGECWIYKAIDENADKSKEYIVKIFSINENDFNTKNPEHPTKTMAEEKMYSIEHELLMLNLSNKGKFTSKEMHFDPNNCSIEVMEGNEKPGLIGSNGPTKQLVIITQPFVPGDEATRVINKLYEDLNEAMSNKDGLTSLKILAQGFQILIELIKELKNFHKTTQCAHGDSWLNNFHIQNADGTKIESGNFNKKIVARLLDFDGCFPLDISPAEYKEVIRRLGPGVPFNPDELPSNLDSKHIKHYSKPPKLTETVDLHTLMGSFIPEFLLSLENVANLGYQNHGTFLPHQQQYITKTISAFAGEFVIWAIANCCNSERFFKEISDLPLIQKALQEREKKMVEQKLTYNFKSNDISKIMKMVEDYFNEPTNTEFSKHHSVKERTYEREMEMVESLRKKCLLPHELHREEILSTLEQFIKKGFLFRGKPMTDQKARQVIANLRVKLYEQFTDEPAMHARISTNEALKHVEQQYNKINHLIDLAKSNSHHMNPNHNNNNNL